MCRLLLLENRLLDIAFSNGDARDLRAGEKCEKWPVYNIFIISGRFLMMWLSPFYCIVLFTQIGNGQLLCRGRLEQVADQSHPQIGG